MLRQICTKHKLMLYLYKMKLALKFQKSSRRRGIAGAERGRWWKQSNSAVDAGPHLTEGGRGAQVLSDLAEKWNLEDQRQKKRCGTLRFSWWSYFSWECRLTKQILLSRYAGNKHVREDTARGGRQLFHCCNESSQISKERGLDWSLR